MITKASFEKKIKEIDTDESEIHNAFLRITYHKKRQKPVTLFLSTIAKII